MGQGVVRLDGSAKGLRRQPNKPAEYFSEMTLVMKPDQIANLADRESLRLQEPPSMIDSNPVQIFDKSESYGSLESATQVIRVASLRHGDIRDFDWFGIFRVDSTCLTWTW
ncbi:MAG: hypothetical protein Q7S40_08550 [Opitutaceae bacterium]|nr:hypothetical protein [Opitutaceae bacterium]